jgi:hypothetical protein
LGIFKDSLDAFKGYLERPDKPLIQNKDVKITKITMWLRGRQNKVIFTSPGVLQAPQPWALQSVLTFMHQALGRLEQRSGRYAFGLGSGLDFGLRPFMLS